MWENWLVFRLDGLRNSEQTKIIRIAELFQKTRTKMKRERARNYGNWKCCKKRAEKSGAGRARAGQEMGETVEWRLGCCQQPRQQVGRLRPEANFVWSLGGFWPGFDSLHLCTKFADRGGATKIGCCCCRKCDTNSNNISLISFLFYISIPRQLNSRYACPLLCCRQHLSHTWEQITWHL